MTVDKMSVDKMSLDGTARRQFLKVVFLFDVDFHPKDFQLHELRWDAEIVSPYPFFSFLFSDTKNCR
jgi:hypothetical protein